MNPSEKIERENNYLEKHVFNGLTNLNNGFDVEDIKYFSADEFQIVLDRVKNLGLGIYGIEPWKNGEFYGVLTYEMLTHDPTNPDWYMKVFEDIKNQEEDLQYAASYFIPEKLLNKNN